MKITFTLGQVKQFNSLPAEERERILAQYICQIYSL